MNTSEERLEKPERLARLLLNDMSSRVRRHKTIRKKIAGTPECPRLSVYKSTKHIFAQIIDDSKGVTLVASSDSKLSGSKVERAYKVGKKLATLAKAKKITKVVFDRGGFLYHGRVLKLAEGAREGGLKF